MRFSFSEREQAIRLLGRRLAEALHRFGIPIDEANDAVPPALEGEVRDVCIASGHFAPNFPVELGGAGLSLGEQVLLEEQVGRVSSCVWSVLWRPANVVI